MNASLTINFCGTTIMEIKVTNALLEEYPDGHSLHGDNELAVMIRKTDCIHHAVSNSNDVFVMNNGSKLTIEWE